MRELSQIEMDVISGGDRSDIVAVASVIGGGLGSIAGASGTPVASAVMGGLGTLAGRAAGNLIANLLGEE